MIDITPYAETLNGKPVAIFGLGVSGMATVQAFKAAGVRIYVWDDKPSVREAAQELGAEVVLPDEELLKTCGALILSPGVPLTHPEPHFVVKAAQAAGIEIIGDLEVLHRSQHKRKTIGITGTNGKSTTTALLNHILKEAGYEPQMGGNIGPAVLGLDVPPENSAFVLEISSFQADLCPTFRPDISVLLNVTSDHIDRHGSFEGYIKAKEHLFEGSGEAVISLDDDVCYKLYERVLAFELGQRRPVPFSCRRDLKEGVSLDDGKVIDALDAKEFEAGSLKGIPTLRGEHNCQNALAAYTVCRLLGLEPEEIIRHINTYPGLDHRQYPVRTINSVMYINDSKATNAVSTAKALGAYNNIYWILGGRAKADGLKGLDQLMSHVKEAFLIGEASDEFARWLDGTHTPYTRCETLDKAVIEAHKAAQDKRGQPGGNNVVLLSPACASYDQFTSFSERGDVFARYVSMLPEDGNVDIVTGLFEE